MLEGGLGLESAWPPPILLDILFLNNDWVGPAVTVVILGLVYRGAQLLKASHLRLGGGILVDATPTPSRPSVLARKSDAKRNLIREVTLERRALLMNLEGLLQDSIELIRLLLCVKLVALVISEQVIRGLLLRLLARIKNQGVFAELFEVTALVHYAVLEIVMAQLRFGLERKFSFLGVLVLTSSDEEEHDCDAQGGEGIIYGEVDNAGLVENLHPHFGRVVSLRRHASEYDGDGVEDDEEHDEERALDLVGLELTSLLGQLRLLQLEEEGEELDEGADHQEGDGQSEPVHDPDERLVSIVKAEYLLLAFRSLLFPIIVKISWVQVVHEDEKHGGYN